MVLKEIQNIKKFREKEKGQFTSTSHTFPLTKFLNIAIELQKTFGEYSVEINCNGAIVRIPR